MPPLVRNALAATAAGALLATAATVPAGAAEDVVTPTGVTASADPSVSVPLVTGDVVHLTTDGDGRESIRIDHAPGGSGSAQTMHIAGDTYVIPDSAMPYLGSGALDRRLFNVSDLVEDGYVGESTLPLIVQYDARQRRQPTPAGSDKTRALPSIRGAAVETEHDDTAQFWSSLTDSTTTRRSADPGTFGGGVSRIWLDGRSEAALDVSVPLVGAPEVWETGHDGEGATVAVLDTGVDAGHPDLAGQLTATRSFVPDEEVTDVNGHGTHVASTVAGTGVGDGAHTGVAPGADLAIGKVLADAGYGLDSWIIAGMEWAATDVDADVVSMSLGDDTRTDQDNPLAQSLNRLSAQEDVLFVVAAGNSGGTGTVGTPGTADAALTIAATDDQDQLAYFSSRGPRGIDDGLKPDMAAPGVGISAARSQYAAGSGLYRALNGTSMATPHVSGAAAILAAMHPEWGAERLKDALMSSTVDLDYSAYETGTGRLDVPATVDGFEGTGSVYFGKATWGEPEPGPTTKPVTWYNAGDEPLELDLSLDTEGVPDSQEPVRLSADQVTVPARGTATVDATADFATVPEPGQYLGEIVARDAAGDVVARTGTGLTREDERYDLDVEVLGPDGRPLAAEVLIYRYGTTDFGVVPTDPASGATPTQRVAPGTFAVHTRVRFAAEDGTDRWYFLSEPHVSVEDGDVSVQLDASEASPVELETPRPSQEGNTQVEWFHDSGTGGSLSTVLMGIVATAGQEVWVNPTDEVPGRFDLTAHWSRTEELFRLAAYTPAREDLAATYLLGSARLDGEVDLPVVDAGTGTPEEIAAVDAQGKALLVTNSSSVSPFARAAAARDAGAALLVVANDGPGSLFGFAGGSDVPTITISAEAGRDLRNADPATRRIAGTATATPEYGYEIVRTWEGAVPADPTAAPTTRDLARVTERFADTESRPLTMAYSACPDYRRLCIGAAHGWTSGGEHVTYVSPETASAATWRAAVYSSTGWDLRDAPRRFAPGEHATHDWFGVSAPRQGAGFWTSHTRGQRVAVNMPMASTTGDVTGTRTGNRTVSTRLYRGDELLRSSGSQSVQTTVPEASGRQQFRLEMDTEVAPEVWPWSTRTSSVWTFGVDQAVDGDLPLIAIGYDVATGLDGAVSAAGGVDLALRAWHEEGAVGAGDLTGLDLEVSYDDGATWQPAPTTRHGDEWRVSLERLPRSADAVSLRTTVTDDAGNTVTQEVVRAFGLR